MRALTGFAALFLVVLAPLASAQKPPAPSPQPNPPPGAGSGRASVPTNRDIQPEAFSGERVMYITGSVVTNDGTPIPPSMIVERVCNSRVRQQVYSDNQGGFSMELGGVTTTVLDATGESDARENRTSAKPDSATLGVPRRDLVNCELRASLGGFRSRSVQLMEITPSLNRLEVGTIVLERTKKVRGLTLSAAPYQAPDNARRAYVKGLEAVRHEKLTEARQHFEQAVKLYPKYTSAWFELGAVLRREKENEAARDAFLQSTALDSKFLPPYISLASMAFQDRDWKQVLGLTRHILSLDPLNYSKISGHVIDLDSVDYAEAYFYDAAANFQLNRINEAEKSALQAERLDLRPRFPQLHLLLADIFARQDNNARAIEELNIFLATVPQGRNADLARERLATLEKASAAAPAPATLHQD